MPSHQLLFQFRLIFAGARQKKLLVLEALNTELKDFIDNCWNPELDGAKKGFLLFAARFVDCAKAVHQLMETGFTRQANMVNRHALECAVYLGAIANYPSLHNAIASQEIYQRRNLRAAAAQIGVITQAERARMDQISNHQLQLAQNELAALSARISEKKAARGWAKTGTSIELTIADLALCSDLFDTFKRLHPNLNMSVHVFFGTLVEDHTVQVEGVDLIRTSNDVKDLQPVADAVVLIGAVLQQVDKLFGTDLFRTSETRFVKHWPNDGIVHLSTE